MFRAVPNRQQPWLLKSPIVPVNWGFGADSIAPKAFTAVVRNGMSLSCLEMANALLFYTINAVISTVATMSMASAADLPTKGPAYAPPEAAPYNWTGSYVGGHFGYAWGSDPIDLTPGTAFPTGTVPFSLADNPRGVLGGIQYGTNWQFNRFVLGWDSDFSFSDIKRSQRSSQLRAASRQRVLANKSLIGLARRVGE